MALKNVKRADIKELLDDAYERFARPEFITDDPIQIPRSFDDRKDAEVIGFLTATIAWGQRKTIISNARKLVQLMDASPYAFITSASSSEIDRLDGFVHRTFNDIDLRHFVFGLRHLYNAYGGLENAFLSDRAASREPRANESSLGADDPWLASERIARFKQRFFEPAHQPRTQKHVADPSKGSNAKRINMFLRWMVRPNDRGVDLGLWKKIPCSQLMVPLDVHTGRVGRELGLLYRTQDDWKAVEELTTNLRAMDPADPVKYDIALFALGVEGNKALRPSHLAG